MFEAGGEAVVGIAADGVDPGESAEALVGAAGLDAEAAGGDGGVAGGGDGVDGGLVVVAEDGHVDAVVAVVGEFDDGVFGYFALDGEDPGLDVGPGAVGGNVVVIGVEGVEGGADTGVEAGEGGEEAGRAGGGGVVEGSEDGEGAVDAFEGGAGAIKE